MEDGHIEDNQITASDFQENVGRSRLVGPEGDTDLVWWPDPANPDKWIQVDLTVQRLLTGVITQGRRRSTDGEIQFVTKFTVQFSNDGMSFENVKITDSEALVSYFLAVG